MLSCDECWSEWQEVGPRWEAHEVTLWCDVCRADVEYTHMTSEPLVEAL